MKAMLTLILDIPQRKIFYISSSPASFLIVDDKAGGILINTPVFSKALLDEMNALTIFFYPANLAAVRSMNGRQQQMQKQSLMRSKQEKLTQRLILR